MWYLRDSGGTQNTAMEAKGTNTGHELDTGIWDNMFLPGECPTEGVYPYR